MAVQVDTFVNGSLEENCYLIYDSARAEAVVIDPGAEAERLCQTLDRQGLKPVLILATHGHFDHVGGVQALQQRYGAPFGLAKADAELLDVLEDSYAFYGLGSTKKPAVDRWLVAGEVLQAGGLDLRVLGTPGHTQGGLCFYHPGSASLFSGDTLFAGSVGRSDFEGGDHGQLVASIKAELLGLPDATRVFPGHGEASTIGQERAENRFLR
ncbi:MAG TPA: MBL fold metallo-hydrolase [bacterium]|nr:MBL fold metallo-hydrolase [bacterium]